jgi:hypothetical protein
MSWRRFSSRAACSALSLGLRGSGRAGRPAACATGPAAGFAAPAGVHLALGVFKVVAHGGQRRVGQGLVARPLSASPPPGHVGLGNGLGLVGALGGLGIDQDHLQRRVLEHAVKALGVDKAHREQGGMHGHRHAQRDLQRAEGGRKESGFHGAGLSVLARRLSASFTSTAMAMGPATASSSSHRRPLGHRRWVVRVVQALEHGAVHVQRDFVDLAQAHAQARAARQVLRAQHGKHQRQRVGAHQKAAAGPSLNTVASAR